jgi:MtN3 and saliva related transmembrane protein
MRLSPRRRNSADRCNDGDRTLEDRPVSVAWTMCATALIFSLAVLCGCSELVPRDTQSLLHSGLKRSEVFGFLAGLGTTFAAIPDLIAMLKRRSSAGMNPRMAAIMGIFQLLWIYYGLLIASRPVIVWNVIAVAINFITVTAYYHYARREQLARAQLSRAPERRARGLP